MSNLPVLSMHANGLYSLSNHYLCQLIIGNANLNVLMARGRLHPSGHDGHRHDLKLATKMPVFPQINELIKLIELLLDSNEGSERSEVEY